MPRLTKARCRRCGKQATTDHVICPHCGRELRAAPSRLLTIGAPAFLVGALALALVARVMPSFLRESDNLPLLQNFVITPVSADSEPSSRPERESLAPAVVQSGAGQFGEPTPADAATAATALPPPPPLERTSATGGGSQTQVADAATPPPTTEASTENAAPPAETPTPAGETTTPTATPSAIPKATEAATPSPITPAR